MENRTARLTILIDPRKKQIFEEICAAHDLTPSQVVRKLVRQYIIDNAGGRDLPEWLKPAGKAADQRALAGFRRAHLVWVVGRDVGIVPGLHLRPLPGKFAQDARDGPDHHGDTPGRAGHGFRGRRRKIGKNHPLAGGEPADADGDARQPEDIGQRVGEDAAGQAGAGRAGRREHGLPL